MGVVVERNAPVGPDEPAQQIDQVIGRQVWRADMLSFQRRVNQPFEEFGRRLLLQERIIHPHPLLRPSAKAIPWKCGGLYANSV